MSKTIHESLKQVYFRISDLAIGLLKVTGAFENKSQSETLDLAIKAYAISKLSEATYQDVVEKVGK